MVNNGRLYGKNILVTASGQGIGKASILAMANEGANVLATDVNEQLLSEINQLNINNIKTSYLDVRDEKSIFDCVKEANPDVLFNCAGFVHNGSLLECSEKDWDEAFEINVRSMFRTIKNTLPIMIEKGGGSIINMSSCASSVKGFKNRFIYGTTKAAVIGLTKSVAKDYIQNGIRCNAICPGTVDSPSLHERLEATGNYDLALKNFIARQPIGRLAKADEIAALVIYLASDESLYMTGQEHRIDGGISAISNE